MPETRSVALFVFNRPDLTQRVVDAIRKAAPTQMLVIADGPRNETEYEICMRTRAVVLDAIDWPCTVETDFAESNLGCRDRLSSGLDWVFSMTDEAIVLEDDCVPIEPFFSYCSELLERYRDDERVMHIGGVNLAPGRWTSEASYCFSANTHVWGWATWRRAWAHYDVTMSGWPAFAASGLLASVATSRREEAYYRWVYELVASGHIDTWDYQWQLACWMQSGLATIPRTSLVKNIGFRADATHLAVEPVGHGDPVALGPLVHPEAVVRDRRLDAAVFKTMLANGPLKRRMSQQARLLRSALLPDGWRR